MSPSTNGAPSADPATARDAVARQGHWYHTMEVAPGVVTPGWFDLRPIVERMPWPDVRGKRCLDVGTYDGFLAFELERRGASEVIATDIGDPSEWDWAVLMRDEGPERLERIVGPDPGAGFKIARKLLGSHVERVEVSAYDLSPQRVDTFDVVTCGSLLLHLKDPIQALEAIHSVCDGHFLSAETIDVGITLRSPRRPAAAQRGGDDGQWWIPNAAGHRKMLEAAGFEIERRTRPYAIPLGPGHPHRSGGGTLTNQALTRLVCGRPGVGHAAALARPISLPESSARS